MKIELRCCCGAQFSAESEERLSGSEFYRYRVEKLSEDWRKEHRKCIAAHVAREKIDSDDLF